MNRKLFLLPLLMWGTRAAAQCDMTVKLTDKSTDSLIVYVTDETFSHGEREFYVPIKNGKAKFHLEETTPRCVYLLSAANADNPVSFISVPGTKAKVKGNWNEIQVSGHAMYEDETEYKASIKSIVKKMEELAERLSDLQEKGEKDAAAELTKGEWQEAKTDYVAKTREFVHAHPASHYSMYLIAHTWGGESREMEKLTPEVRNGFMKSYVEAQIAAEKAFKEHEARDRQEREKELAQMQGTEALDFTLPTPDGTELSLSSLRGKVVVMDFWGSWCGWCMQGMPELKKYAEKYAGKLEILGVDYGDTEQTWKRTVKENALTWKHVRLDRKDEKTPELLKAYGVDGFPTKAIISADGKIVKIVVGENPEFYKFLDEVLGE